MTNPYKDIADFCFWSRSMTWPTPGRIDPVVKADRITPFEKVATLGSCFAQHLSNHIRESGLDYFVAETAKDISDEEARLRQYGVFSARYGNVYTPRQAVQLFDRAYGRFNPVDAIWEKGATFVDAFRPQIDNDLFATTDLVEKSREEHLFHVRNVFSQCHWLVFTLGLTEAWRSKIDGAIYPIAPGVVAGKFDPNLYEFVNFTAGEVSRDLEDFIKRVRSVNPNVKILLTVSPVPLIATYENRHVLVSTTFSKSALRVAADEMERMFQNVIYFPSYEIITSPAAGGRYYEDDLRQVTELGVKHVMRVFSEHFFFELNIDTSASPAPGQRSCSEKVLDTSSPDTDNSQEDESAMGVLLASMDGISTANPSTNVQERMQFPKEREVVCDEEIIEKALKISGF